MNDELHSEAACRRFGVGGCLVIMAATLLLLALLLPAVQASREAERRNSCNNNLKQIGLGLQTYADIHKHFPYDALWGRQPGGDTKQGAYHYPWSVSILLLLGSHPPDFHPIDERLPIWNQSQEYGTGGVGKITPPMYFGYIQSQQIPPYKCPSDLTFSGPGDMPGLCMWTDYAGSVGVGFYSAKLKQGSNCEAETTAPLRTRGLFAFNDPVGLSAVRDGTSQTIAVAEVTSNGAAARNGTQYSTHLKDDLVFAADSDQPLPNGSSRSAQAGTLMLRESDAEQSLPTRWSLRGSDISWSPGPLLAGGSGMRRANLMTKPASGTYVPMVFRAAMVAFTESVTGSGPCSLPGVYSAAQGGACGQTSGASSIAGFEFSGKVAQAPIVGIAPLYNALYGPNSNWPGPDSNHPGVVLAVYADGHATTIQNGIDFSVWASLNTRAGGEVIDGDD